MGNNFENNKALVKKMQSGDEMAIKDGLNHSGALLRINGIINAVRNNIRSEECIDMIKKLKTDNTIVSGYKISDFSIAALDILNVESYVGNEFAIVELIKSNFDF